MWPFRKKAPPKPEPPVVPMSEDWAVGDEAECVLKGSWVRNDGLPGVGPEAGDILTVAAISGPHICFDGERYFCLKFKSTGKELYQESCFRKVPPLSEQESFTITAKIKRCKPVRIDA